jgi:predicted Ser/Thr protein kinase
MYACGQAGPPREITCKEQIWRLETLFKHDFFACTARYECAETGELAVLKIGRVVSFLGIPLRWLGRGLCKRELKVLSQLQGIDQVPQIISTFGRTGFLYHYIEGKSLDEKPDLPDSFFDELTELVRRIHTHDVCYVDMNKRGNILLGDDNRPHMIDFQISKYIPGTLSRPIRKYLQKEDIYHLLKHKRKFRPDLLTEDEKQRLAKISWPIRVHRTLTGPLRDLRRAFLRHLYKKDILRTDSTADRSPENNPDRFLK